MLTFLMHHNVLWGNETKQKCFKCGFSISIKLDILYQLTINNPNDFHKFTTKKLLFFYRINAYITY